jgi:hypothetical protein
MKNRGVRSAVDFAGVFQRDVDAVFEAAWSIVRNREAAADITQQTFVEAWAEFDNTPLEMFDMWLLARARDRAFNWMQVHRPAGLNGDGRADDDVTSAGLGAVLRARIVRVLVRENVPVRGERLPDRVIPVESLAQPEPDGPPPPPPDVVHTPPAPQPRVVPQPEVRAVAVERPGRVKRPRPRPRAPGKAPAERQEILWQRLTGVGVGALVGLVVIAAVRVNDGGSDDPETEPSSALGEAPDEHASHDMTTTTVAAPPTSAQLVVATQPTTTTTRRPATTRPPLPTTAPPPPAPPVISSLTGTLSDGVNCDFTPTMEFAHQLVLTWSATGATGGRVRPDDGPWVPVHAGAGRYEVCAPAGRTWHLELTGPGGTTSASTTPPAPPGWFFGVTPAPAPGG